MAGVFREQIFQGAQADQEFKLVGGRKRNLVAFGEESAGGVPMPGAQVFLLHEQVEAAVPFVVQDGVLLRFGAMVGRACALLWGEEPGAASFDGFVGDGRAEKIVLGLPDVELDAVAHKSFVKGICEGFGVFGAELERAWMPSLQEHVVGVGDHQLLREQLGENSRFFGGQKPSAGG